MDQTEIFEAERPRLLGIASRVLGDHAEAEDVVQQAWLRLDRAVTRDESEIENLPAWLTTVTTRLCLDRLRARTPVPVEEVEIAATAPDPADDVALADTVGIALQAVIDRLSPRERVAFVLHDSFGFEFGTIAAVLDTTPVAARKLASRARAKVAQPAAEDALADWEVVDAFMAAARGGDFQRLLQLPRPTPSSAPTRPRSSPAPRRRSRAATRWLLLQRQCPGRPAGPRRRPGDAWYWRGSPRWSSTSPSTRPGHRHHLPRGARRPRPGRTPLRRRAEVTGDLPVRTLNDGRRVAAVTRRRPGSSA